MESLKWLACMRLPWPFCVLLQDARILSDGPLHKSLLEQLLVPLQWVAGLGCGSKPTVSAIHKTASKRNLDMFFFGNSVHVPHWYLENTMKTRIYHIMYLDFPMQLYISHINIILTYIQYFASISYVFGISRSIWIFFFDLRRRRPWAAAIVYRKIMWQRSWSFCPLAFRQFFTRLHQIAPHKTPKNKLFLYNPRTMHHSRPVANPARKGGQIVSHCKPLVFLANFPALIHNCSIKQCIVGSIFLATHPDSNWNLFDLAVTATHF